MDRKETTKWLSELLYQDKLSGMGRHWASEVTVENRGRVDYMLFEPENGFDIGAIEKGIFTCFEIKSCKADYNSGHGLNFVGEKNYIVMTMDTYKALLHPELEGLSVHVGVLVACPENRDLADEFIEPTPLDTDVEWKLKAARGCFKGPRKLSMTELLFCMLRSGRE